MCLLFRLSEVFTAGEAQDSAAHRVRERSNDGMQNAVDEAKHGRASWRAGCGTHCEKQKFRYAACPTNSADLH